MSQAEGKVNSHSTNRIQLCAEPAEALGSAKECFGRAASEPSVTDVEEQHLGTALRKHIGPGHVECAFGRPVPGQKKAGTARSRTDEHMRDAIVMISVYLLENVDEA